MCEIPGRTRPCKRRKYSWCCRGWGRKRRDRRGNRKRKSEREKKRERERSREKEREE